MRVLGYQCEKCRVPGGRFGKQDLFGYDLMAKSKSGTVYIQVKSGGACVKTEIDKLRRDDNWPPCDAVIRLLHIWRPRAREPLVFEV